jgi:hypothetical protein
MTEWNQEIMSLLDKIRLNSITLSNKHRLIALSYQTISRYFEVPIIICSTISSSLGSFEYIPENDKASITLFISMFITILTSIKLYLNITSNLNNEIVLSREFCDIYKNLHLQIKDRPDGKQFLNESYNQYIKLTEQSNLFNKLKRDELLKIDSKLEDESLSSSSSSSDLSSMGSMTHYDPRLQAELNDSPTMSPLNARFRKYQLEIKTEQNEI